MRSFGLLLVVVGALACGDDTSGGGDGGDPGGAGGAGGDGGDGGFIVPNGGDGGGFNFGGDGGGGGEPVVCDAALPACGECVDDSCADALRACGRTGACSNAWAEALDCACTAQEQGGDPAPCVSDFNSVSETAAALGACVTASCGEACL